MLHIPAVKGIDLAVAATTGALGTQEVNICGIMKRFQGNFRFQRSANTGNALRFNPIRSAEWIATFLPKNCISKDKAAIPLADRMTERRPSRRFSSSNKV